MKPYFITLRIKPSNGLYCRCKILLLKNTFISFCEKSKQTTVFVKNKNVMIAFYLVAASAMIEKSDPGSFGKDPEGDVACQEANRIDV